MRESALSRRVAWAGPGLRSVRGCSPWDRAGAEPAPYAELFSFSLGEAQPKGLEQGFQPGEVGGQHHTGLLIGQVGKLAQIPFG